MTNRLCAVLWPSVFVCFTIAMSAARADQSGQQAGSQTVILAGRVVDSRSGSPVAESVVKLTEVLASATASSTGNQVPPLDVVLTDAQGRFYFAAVPTGSYLVIASKDGYIEGAYGKSRYFEAAQPLSLLGNRIDVRVELWRLAVVTGSVTDGVGEAVMGQKVAILQRQVVSGRALFTGQATAFTDDRGIFRSSLLQPGDYTACLPSVQTTLPSDVFSLYSTGRLVLDRHLRRQLNFLGSELPAPGSQGIKQVDDVIWSSSSSLLTASPGDVYALTCSPSTSTFADAVLVQLGPGDISPRIAIRVVPTRGHSIYGRLSGPEGPAGHTTVRLLARTTSSLLRDTGFETAIALTDASGGFRFLGVPSGQYVIQASLMTSDSGRTLQSGASALRWLAYDLTVDAEVRDLDLRLQEGFLIKGHVALEDGRGAGVKPPLSRFMLALEPVDGRPRGIQAAAPASDGAFSVKDVPPGRYFLRASNPPPGWSLRDALLNGRDVSDESLDVSVDDASDIMATFTNHSTEIAITAFGPSGKPEPRAPTIYVVTTNKRYWVDYGWNPRRLREARADLDGKAQFLGLPAGDYFVVALSADAVAQLHGLTETLEFVSRQGQQIRLGVGEVRQVRLSINGVGR